MITFKIVIEESLSQEFEVIAETAEDAMNIASDKYRTGEFVLEPGELTHKQMAIVSPDDEATEWTEF